MSFSFVFHIAEAPGGGDFIAREFMKLSVTQPNNKSSQDKRVFIFYGALRFSPVKFLYSMGLRRDETHENGSHSRSSNWRIVWYGTTERFDDDAILCEACPRCSGLIT